MPSKSAGAEPTQRPVIVDKKPSEIKRHHKVILGILSAVPFIYFIAGTAVFVWGSLSGRIYIESFFSSALYYTINAVGGAATLLMIIFCIRHAYRNIGGPNRGAKLSWWIILLIWACPVSVPLYYFLHILPSKSAGPRKE
jgi:ABC-type Fe3+ transport system permease subunit